MTEREEVEFEGEELREAWKRGEPARLVFEEPGSSILSIRVPRRLLRELSEAARAANKAPGTLARELIEIGLVQHGAASAATMASILARLVNELSVHSRMEPSAGSLHTDPEIHVELKGCTEWLRDPHVQTLGRRDPSHFGRTRRAGRDEAIAL